MESVHLDFETRSCTDLRKAGVYRYAEDPTTMPWGFSYRFGDMGEVMQWRPGFPDPVALLNHVAAGGAFVCHNAAFERTIWNTICRRHYPHWPPIQIAQQDCTMSRAAASSHPQDLDTLCNALQTTNKKDRDGHALMMKMARPRKFNVDGTITWWDDPADVRRLMDYCDRDVLTECDVDKKLPPLTDYERRVWQLDQLINERGIPIDIKAVEKCVTLVELAKKSADSEMRRLTNRAVPKCSNDKKIIDWIVGQGIECTTVKKGVQQDLIFMADLHNRSVVADVINLRADAKKTSTAKYAAMKLCICYDGRIRGTLSYWGAGPGRWAGRLIQPQNYPRVDHDRDGWIFEWLAQLLDSDMDAATIFECLVTVHGESGENAPLRLLSRFLRSTIKAPPGKKLIGGDFSNIEGRVNAFLAGEHWKLRAFAAQDDGTGEDLYRLTYARTFGIPIEEVDGGKDKGPQRQIGKVEELALGYQGSVGAFMDMGPNYGVNPYDVSKAVILTADAATWDRTAARYASATNKEGLQEKEWTAIKIIVDGWRASNPMIVQSWWDLQDAAIEAMSMPGTAVKVLNGRVTYYFDNRCLWCVLPSGRMICYASPRLETVQEEYIDKFTGETKTRWKKRVRFWGYKEGAWRELYLYGGLQCENIVQGTARCIMVDRMFAAEHRGYPIILTVHDELLAEVDASRLDLNEKDFRTIMKVVPAFVAGMPMDAKTFEDVRYIK